MGEQLSEYIEKSYQDIDVESLICEIDFAKQICLADDHMMGKIEHGIPLGRLYGILARHIPQIKTYLIKTYGTDSPDNT